jgi:glycosyltransferase involved in cell wall biosynthesis
MSNEQSASQIDGRPDAATSLRIAVVSDALKDRNGVDAYYRDLVSHLEGHVADIKYFTPNPEDGDHYSRFRLPLPGDATQQLIFPHASGVYAELKEQQPHVIVAATNGPFGLLALYAALRLGVPLVAGFHTLIEDLCKMYWGRMLGTVTRSYMEFQNWLLFKNAACVVVNSKSMIESASNLSDTRISLMGTPLDQRFLAEPIPAAPQSLDSILYAGRLAPEKNIEGLLECARRFPAIRFSIAGEGPLRDDIEALAGELDNLNFMGHLPREQIVGVIDEHDMLILPSHLEAFGTIALEAMMRRRLVLVSSHCGILSWENLARGLFQFPDNEHPADAIARLCETDPLLREKKARTAMETAQAAHEEAVHGWLNLFSELQQNKGKDND